jgi:hypothetical protein
MNTRINRPVPSLLTVEKNRETVEKEEESVEKTVENFFS